MMEAIELAIRQAQSDRSAQRLRGFTLLELLLALGLIILVLSLTSLFYHNVLKTREITQTNMRRRTAAMQIATQIAAEIRSTNGFLRSFGLKRAAGVSGDDRMIKLETVRLPDREVMRMRKVNEEPLPAEADVRQVQYYLGYDYLDDVNHVYEDGRTAPAPLGLVRRETKTLNQATQLNPLGEDVQLDLIAPDIKYLKFRYYDGYQWVRDWDIGDDAEGSGGNALPQAVEITLGYDVLPPKMEQDFNPDEDPDLAPAPLEAYSPDKVTLTVRLSQADSFFGSRLMRAQRRSRRSLESAGGGMQ